MAAETSLSPAFKAVVDETRRLVDLTGDNRDVTLQQICTKLREQIDIFDWVGFYIVDPDAEDELVLGPYVGEPTEHTRIPFGKGICGQSAETNETFVVQDVNEADNYLACSIDVKAEIVVPVKVKGEFVAELDIDSHTRNSITPEHRLMLEEICDIVSELFS